MRCDRPATREEVAQRASFLGVVYQAYYLVPELDVLENVTLPARITGRFDPSIEDRARFLLEQMGVGNKSSQIPGKLSGGERQRVAIARALINRPEVLLADEPTGNVDDRIAARLMHLFDELNKLGTTVIIATHNESIIQEFRRPILRIESGRLTVVPLDKDNKSSDNKSNVKRATQLLESLSQE